MEKIRIRPGLTSQNRNTGYQNYPNGSVSNPLRDGGGGGGDGVMTVNLLYQSTEII
jgi:hypothetical protein